MFEPHHGVHPFMDAYGDNNDIGMVFHIVLFRLVITGGFPRVVNWQSIQLVLSHCSKGVSIGLLGPIQASILVTAFHSAMAMRRWIWMASAECLERGGTKRFLNAEKILMNRCRLPGNRKPASFALVFVGADVNFPPCYSNPCGSDARHPA
jgi:putative hemolysin